MDFFEAVFFLHFKLFLLNEAGSESVEQKINELHTGKNADG